MSDFDKEAEREKLRKKFARDEEKRAHTQRMSELLLKGATMTNKHCEQCSDPLFRYNGQTFCPSCQAEADAQPDSDTDADSTPSPTAREEPSDHPDAVETSSSSTPPAASSPTPPAVETDPTVETAATTQPSADGIEGLAVARQSLERTVTRFAQRAEATEDPRRARELLAAAREAAATLSTLE